MQFLMQNSYYTPVKQKKVPEKYFAKNDRDYWQEKNLLSGKGQSIISAGAIDGPSATPQFNTPDTEKRLTDGVLALRPTYSDPAWFRFTRGVARTIIFDLEGICAVSEFHIRFLYEKETAVKLPRNVAFAVSTDGENYETVVILDQLRTDRDSDIVSLVAKLDEKVKARFIRVTFTCPVHIYIDQIEAIGKKNIEGARDIVPDEPETSTYPHRYCDASRLGGAKDVILAYFCHEEREPLDVSAFKPYVGYLNEEGKATDTFFDGYLFLPFVAFLYKGYVKKPLNKEKWQYYMDQQFLPGKNLDALEEAVAEVEQDLGLKDMKVKVFFSILYPVVEQHEFGTVDGKMRDLSVLEDRIAALKWLIDEQEQRFIEKKYQHLELSGYYWFTEEIDYDDKQLLEMIRFTTDYIRQKKMITTWIPYYQASGFDDWRRLGFDMACYQPNYAFHQNIPEQRLFDAAETAKTMGMCIELEVGGTAEWNIQHTRNYYAAGAVTGYMKDAAHMYYQGGMPGEFYRAYHSKDKELHSMYDDTYRFVKGTYPEDGFDIPETKEE